VYLTPVPPKQTSGLRLGKAQTYESGAPSHCVLATCTGPFCTIWAICWKAGSLCSGEPVREAERRFGLPQIGIDRQRLQRSGLALAPCFVLAHPAVLPHQVVADRELGIVLGIPRLLLNSVAQAAQGIFKAGPRTLVSGNIWTANAGTNSLTEFVGIATPVVTPLAARIH
jgi:hypothetical protein